MSNGNRYLVPAVVAGLGLAFVFRMLRHSKPYSFKDKSVVITGGSRGLGLVIARELAREGARLTILARNGGELMHAEEDLRSLGAEVLALPCDIRVQSQVEEAIKTARERFGGIDVLINDAGVIQVGPLENLQIEDFEDAMRVHVWGPLYTMLATIPIMKEQGGGRIVNISSIGGRIAVPHLMPYSASKFALVGLSDGMRTELAKDHIHVTTVSPGLMRTGSPPNAFFKGHQREEYTWFAIMDALPLFSTSARQAAQQIIEACRYGDPELTITWQARMAVLANAVFPDLTAEMMKLVNRFMPQPNPDPAGDELKTGWESESALAPSILTTLSDDASMRNNELRETATDVFAPVENAEHAEMVREALEIEKKLDSAPNLRVDAGPANEETITSEEV